jgi:pyruvate dehydrogenase E2 component (dihydrolipoamide acetyltransferase)
MSRLDIEPRRVHGSGPDGRIIEADVRAAANKSSAPVPAPESKSATPSVTPGQVSVMRRSIAERTALSFATIPHFYLRAEVDATDLIRMREHLVAVLEQECGVRVTVTDLLLRAQALALRDFPAANSVWQNDSIVRYGEVDIGVVVGLADGLLIPLIRGADRLTLVQLAKERVRLVAAARTGKINAAMFSGGASSLSNLGTTRADEFAAIIAPHQSSMLAVGRAALRPFVVDGRLEVRTTLRLCLSVDHRVLDGGPAADFLGHVVELIENPARLFPDSGSKPAAICRSHQDRAGNCSS